MGIGKIIPAFIAGVGVTLGAPYAKDYYDNNIGNYKYPLVNFRNVAPEMHLYDANNDDILDKEETRRYALAFSQNGVFTSHSVFSLTTVRQNINNTFPPGQRMFSSNVQTTLQNLEEVQDEILREQIAKAEQIAKK